MRRIIYLFIYFCCLWIFVVAKRCGPSKETVFHFPSHSSSETVLHLPSRSSDALSGSKFVELISKLSLQEREEIIYSEITQGNIPNFLRKLVPITIKEEVNGKIYTITYYVTSDYMALGSDEDYFLNPMTPILAQQIADFLYCCLPTRKMVNEIWKASEVKLQPYPISPSPDMITIPVFAKHNEAVWGQRSVFLDEYPLGALVSGDKKDVVLSNLIFGHQDRVVIYGWHYLNGKAIQPLYSGHFNFYADYSHGVRLVLLNCIINGLKCKITDILSDPELYVLFSDEACPMQMTYYLADKSAYPY